MSYTKITKIQANHMQNTDKLGPNTKVVLKNLFLVEA